MESSDVLEGSSELTGLLFEEAEGLMGVESRWRKREGNMLGKGQTTRVSALPQ